MRVQMFNKPLNPALRQTAVTGWCGLVAQTFNYAQK